jgi:hypothetical protein
MVLSNVAAMDPLVDVLDGRAIEEFRGPKGCNLMPGGAAWMFDWSEWQSHSGRGSAVECSVTLAGLIPGPCCSFQLRTAKRRSVP